MNDDDFCKNLNFGDSNISDIIRVLEHVKSVYGDIKVLSNDKDYSSADVDIFNFCRGYDDNRIYAIHLGD